MGAVEAAEAVAQGAASGRFAAREHITAAREQLELLQGRATLDGLPSAVMQRVLGALSELVEAHRLLSSDDASADPARFLCPNCRLTVTPTASICGFCWHQLSPARDAP